METLTERNDGTYREKKRGTKTLRLTRNTQIIRQRKMQTEKEREKERGKKSTEEEKYRKTRRE